MIPGDPRSCSIPIMDKRIIRIALSLALVLAASACDESPIPTTGLDLGQSFPERAHWYWKYNNDDRSEAAYFHNRGLTSPGGSDWLTYRLWVAEEQSIVEDIADGDPSDWDLEIFWEEQPGGWYLRGWSANDAGASAHLGTTLLDEGIPFALSNVPPSGTTWAGAAGGQDWTTTVVRETEDLEFNGQVISGAWRIDVASASGGTVLDSSWWLVSGPGFVQFDLPDFRADGADSPWEHIHNETFDSVLGVR
jgi:hypothetical protein